MMDPSRSEIVLECIRERQSIRNFADRPVPESMIQTIIRAGIEAPTAGNIQPWQFVVVIDPGLLKRISDFCRGVLMANLAAYPGEIGARYRTLLDNPDFNLFYHAPVLVMVIGDEKDPHHLYDCTLCAGNMLLAASSLGLGGCWLATADVVDQSPDLMAELRIPEHHGIVAPLIFGYPAPRQPKKPERKEPKVIWID
jgi:nitroreductase